MYLKKSNEYYTIYKYYNEETLKEISIEIMHLEYEFKVSEHNSFADLMWGINYDTSKLDFERTTKAEFIEAYNRFNDMYNDLNIVK